MAFASALRRIFNGSSTPALNIRSQFSSIRLESTLPTLTSPKLFVSGKALHSFNTNTPFHLTVFGFSIRAKSSSYFNGNGFCVFLNLKASVLLNMIEKKRWLCVTLFQIWLMFADTASLFKWILPGLLNALMLILDDLCVMFCHGYNFSVHFPSFFAIS